VGAATRIPRTRTIDGFTADTAAAPGLMVHDLAPMTVVRVRTRNSRYVLVVSRDGNVFVQGGTFFPAPTRAHFAGATAGGSFLKVGWIVRGLRMEIADGGRRIVTSPVHEIAIDPDGPSAIH
jgi:hypothetical protein